MLGKAWLLNLFQFKPETRRRWTGVGCQSSGKTFTFLSVQALRAKSMANVAKDLTGKHALEARERRLRCLSLNSFVYIPR
jgi:hypothetical protein